MCAHLGHPASVNVFLFLFEAKNPGDRLWVSLSGIAGRSILSIFQQSYKDWKGKFVRVCHNDQDPTLLDGFPLYWVNKGKKESKDNFRRARSPEKMGDLDKDLCNFWKGVAFSNITLPTSSIITFEFHEDQLDFHIGSFSPFLQIPFFPVSQIILILPATRTWRNRFVALSALSTRLRLLQAHPQNLLLLLRTWPAKHTDGASSGRLHSDDQVSPQNHQRLGN